MMAQLAALWTRQWQDTARWTACFLFALFVHAGGAFALLSRFDDNGLTANPPSITVDLAPVPMSPEQIETDMPIGPQQTEAEPEPQPEKPEEKPQDSDLQLAPPKPPETPKEKPKKDKSAKLTTAPTAAERRTNTAAAPMAGAGARDSSALPNWKSSLVAQLERNKRYPSDARARGEQGVTQLAFSVDRSGGVHGARIVRSSGYSSLDQETLALVARASPLPPPPPEVHGGSIPIMVPIRYNIR